MGGSLQPRTPAHGARPWRPRWRDRVIAEHNYPFDQYVQVLAGSTTLKSNDDSSSTFVAGDEFVVPRGFKGTWTLSPGFRELLIIETKSLQEGIGQFQ